MTLQEFDAVAHAHPYRPKGVFYSEMFIFMQACLAAGVELVVESGVMHGMSTVMLSAVKRWPVVSIDRARSALDQPLPRGVKFVHGDAMAVLPRILTHSRARRIGVLIDGPKGQLAWTLKDACLTYPAVKVVAIHCPHRGHGETSHTHDPEWDYTRRLDRFVPDEFRCHYPNGPGMTLWERG